MLMGYQAKLVNNQLHWIDIPPSVDDVEVVVLIAPKTPFSTPSDYHPKRQISEKLRNSVQLHADIVNVPELAEEWCFTCEFSNQFASGAIT